MGAKKKRSNVRSKSPKQRSNTISGFTEVQRGRPANHVVCDRPNLKQQTVPRQALVANGRGHVAVARGRDLGSNTGDLKDHTTEDENGTVTFTEQTLGFRFGELVSLTEEGMTIHIPANPNRRIRRRRAPLK